MEWQLRCANGHSREISDDNVLVAPYEFLLPVVTEVIPSATFTTIQSSSSSKILIWQKDVAMGCSNISVHGFIDEAVLSVPPCDAV
jgi:hypothetical protein